MVDLCQQHHTPAFYVGSADDLDPCWFDDVHTVGLTNGTSTLDDTVEEAHRALARIVRIDRCLANPVPA